MEPFVFVDPEPFSGASWTSSRLPYFGMKSAAITATLTGRRASQVARVGTALGSTHSPQAAFMPAKSRSISRSQFCAVSKRDLSLPTCVNRLVVAVWRHGTEVGCTADVDAGGVGVGDREGGSGLGRFEGNFAIALHHGLLHHCTWNVVPHRVRRLAHSLKRDIGVAAANHQADSPMSMTSPRTTLTRGQFAPLLHRSSAAPHSTLPQTRQHVLLRRDLRQ